MSNSDIWTLHKDLAEFFAFVSKIESPIEETISAYLRYHGVLNYGHKAKLFEVLQKRLTHRFGREFSQAEVVDDAGEIRDTLLIRLQGDFQDSYYLSRALPVASSIELLPPGPNQLRTPTRLLPYFGRSTLENRAAFEMYKCIGNTLFISTYGFQYYNASERVFWPMASSRTFSNTIEKYPTRLVSNTVVVIQDQFDSSNFAHFLYDYIGRIIYACEHIEEPLGTLIFIVGGLRNKFHDLLLPIICMKYKLREEQFIFGPIRENWKLAGPVFFFSDQRREIQHPLNLCHPSSIRLVRGLLRSLPTNNDCGNRKIYVSRADATMRRLRNENDLERRLILEGYKSIIMSELTVEDQINALANASVIVGPHGMGLTPIFFNTRDASLVEILHPDIGTDVYFMISKSLGIKYEPIFGRDARVEDHQSYFADEDDILRVC